MTVRARTLTVQQNAIGFQSTDHDANCVRFYGGQHTYVLAFVHHDGIDDLGNVAIVVDHEYAPLACT